MSCQDDLTSVDLDSNVAVQVLERVSAGSGRDENLWGFIDVEKYVTRIGENSSIRVLMWRFPFIPRVILLILQHHRPEPRRSRWSQEDRQDVG